MGTSFSAELEDTVLGTLNDENEDINIQGQKLENTAILNGKYTVSKPNSTSWIELLVCGYIHQFYVFIPDELLNLCKRFYHSQKMFIISRSLNNLHASLSLLIPFQNNTKLVQFGHIDHDILNNKLVTDKDFLIQSFKNTGTCFISYFQSKSVPFKSQCSHYNIKSPSAVISCSNSQCGAIIFDQNKSENNNIIQNAFYYQLPQTQTPIKRTDSVMNCVYSQTEHCIYLHHVARHTNQMLRKQMLRLDLNKIDLNGKWEQYMPVIQIKHRGAFRSDFEIIENDSKLFLLDVPLDGGYNAHFTIFDIETKTYHAINPESHHRWYLEQSIPSNLCYDNIHQNMYCCPSGQGVYCFDLHKIGFSSTFTLKTAIYGCDPKVEDIFCKRKILWLNNRLLYIAHEMAYSNVHKYIVQYYDTRTSCLDSKWMNDNKLTHTLNS